MQPCLPLPLHLKVAEDSPGRELFAFFPHLINIAGLPSGQQGLGVPEVWSLGTVDLSSLWALHGHVTPGAPGAWCLKEFENFQTVSVVKSVAVLFAIYWIINYNCDENIVLKAILQFHSASGEWSCENL